MNRAHLSNAKPPNRLKIQVILLITGTLATTAAGAAEPAARRPDAERLVHACSGCHGTYGHSLAPTPTIAGKSQEAFITAMREFKSGQRISSVMNRIARGYTEDDFATMAQFFEKQWEP